MLKLTIERIDRATRNRILTVGETRLTSENSRNSKAG